MSIRNIIRRIMAWEVVKPKLQSLNQAQVEAHTKPFGNVDKKPPKEG